MPFDPASIPPDLKDRITKGWGSLPPDLQERLTRAGLGPTGAGPAIDIAAPPTAAGQPASLGRVRGSLATPEARSSAVGIVRPAATVAAAGVGAGLGAAGGGIPGAGLGGLQGAGVASSLFDLLEGTGDWRRNLLQGTLAATPYVSSYGQAMTLAQRIIASGLLSGAGGAGYDLVTGQLAPSSSEQAGVIAQDVSGGLAGGMLQETGGSVFGTPGGRPTKASVLPPEEQEFRTRFAREEDIPLPASGRTGSKAVAKVEQVPSSLPVGAERAAGFYNRQLAQTEASIEKRLARIDALSTDANPNFVGERLRDELPQLANELSNAFEQTKTAVKASFRSGVSTDVVPNHFVDTALEVLQESQRSPYPPPRQAGRIAALHREEPPPLPVLYDPAGNPITLQQIARDPRPMTFDQAHFYLKQMAARTFRKGQPVVGSVDDATKARLWGALNEDMTEMLQNHPEAHELFSWSKRAYGLTREALVQRLQPIIDRGDLDQVVGKVLQPGRLDRTLQMKQMLPRDLFDRAAAALARSWYEQARTTGAGGVEGFSSAKMAKAIRPYAKAVGPYGESGQTTSQLDVIFDPDTASFFKEFLRFEPALQSTERLAGNPAGTGQRIGSMAQLAGLAQPIFRPLDPGAYQEAGLALVPSLLGRAVFSDPGIAALTRVGNEGIGPLLAGRTVGALPTSIAAGQGIARGGPSVPEWILRMLGAAQP